MKEVMKSLLIKRLFNLNKQSFSYLTIPLFTANAMIISFLGGFLIGLLL